MQELTKVFNGEPLKIEMIGENEFYIDVTGVARKYGKDFRDWIKNPKVSEMIKLRSEARGLNRAELVLRIGNTQKIHNKLLVSFARFISVKFEIWADDMIYDLLTGKKQLQLENQTKKLKEVENKYTAQISKLKGKVNKKTQHKLITYRDNTQNNLNYKRIKKCTMN